MAEATLYVNGKRISKVKPDELKRAVWNGIRLQSGRNTIKVVGRKGRETITENCVWRLKDAD